MRAQMNLFVGLFVQLFTASVSLGDICRHGDAFEGGCLADGSGCTGEPVHFDAIDLELLRWNASTQTRSRIGEVSAYALVGEIDTWQMYLHGPMFRRNERANPTDIPPVYVSGTWVNKVYRFDNFSFPSKGEPLYAMQKIVGHALAPSTTWAVEEKETGRLKGLLIAEGQPWWLNRMILPEEIYKGGVEYLPADEHPKCSMPFPEEGFHKVFGQVVNTVDCHKSTGVCFFTVWKFYDDQKPIWTNRSEEIAPDCLYYCLADQLDDRPRCRKVGVVLDDKGQKICHRDGRGAVHGMTLGRTDSNDATQFDIFLIYTGGATFVKGDSSMEKAVVKVQIGADGLATDFAITKTEPFAEDLFKTLMPAGMDAGGDHAWLDDTQKWVWISTFREAAAGIHMVSYENGGKLVYSINGIHDFVKNQYAYSAGIHGIGTVGKPGSYLAVATCGCHSTKMCAPTPWVFPIPESYWAAGVFFLLDLSRIPAVNESRQEPIVVHI